MISKDGIDGGNRFDWGRTAEAYAQFRDVYPEEFYQRIISLGLCIEGQHVLDLGRGTGVLPRNLFSFGASFIGADISAEQIEQARRLSAEAGMDIIYAVTSAEEITFPDESFDVVTACQCFMYFDRAVVLPKIRKVLKDGGHFCIMQMSWLPNESEIASHSEKLVLKYNPAWTGGGMKRYTLTSTDWFKEYFELANAVTFDLPVTFTRESWHGRIKACRGIGASSLTEEEIAAFEKEHLGYLGDMPEPFDITHFVSIWNLIKSK